MTAVRKRRMQNANDGSEGTEFTMSIDSLNKDRSLGFSDDEESLTGAIKEGSSPSITRRILAPIGLAQGSSQARFIAEAEETEDDDMDIMEKAVHITNLDKIDHGKLLHKMHDHFKKKVLKWERIAYTYSRFHFAMNFAILTIQIIQMLLHQCSNVWMMMEKELMSGKQNQLKDKSFLNSFGIYKMSEWKRKGALTEHKTAFSDALHTIMTPQCLQVLYGFLTASTALIVALQLKFKLIEKSERYRRGAKVYGRLLRISTYYSMMVESGGKLEDVTALWREAMKNEGKRIPLVRTYSPM